MDVPVASLLVSAASALADAGLEAPRMEAETILADLLGMRRLELFAGPKSISAQAAEEFHKRIKRRALREPAAYIKGSVSFYGREFLVTPEVLIPRPETEELVDYVLGRMKPESKVSILDIGTGSGCIGLTLLLERPAWTGTLTDVSLSALSVARRNAERLGLTEPRVVFMESDLWSAVPGHAKFHVIVSNPPYIHPDEESALEADVAAYEPHQALFHMDPETLALHLMEGAAERLVPGGVFMMETSPRWTSSLKQAADQLFAFAEVRRDISGLERFIFAATE